MSYKPVIVTIDDARRMLIIVRDLVQRDLRSIGIEPTPLIARTFDRAREALSRLSHVNDYGNGIAARFISAEAIEEGIRRVERLSTLEGDIVEIARGVPIEEAYHEARLGAGQCKCTCWASIQASRRAQEIARGHRELEVLVSRYVLCKHIAAAASYVAFLRGLTIGERRALVLGAATLVLADTSLSATKRRDYAKKVLRAAKEWKVIR